MHRSGTSFVASLLAAWNFEDAGFVELNRQMLVACTPAEEGHRDWGWTESERFDAGQLPAFRDRVRGARRRARAGRWFVGLE